MTSVTRIAVLLAGACLATAPAIAQSQSEEARFAQAQQRFSSELARYQSEFDAYQAARARRAPYPPAGGYRQAPPQGYQNQSYGDDRDENGYDPARDYRPGNQDRVLTASDRVYAGSDGRYYCKKSDGTTGLIVGGAAGGVLGNVIDGGHSRTVGTLLGAAVGALAGRAVDQSSSQVRCR